MLRFLLLALFAAVVSANEFHKPHVVDLKGKSFEEKARIAAAELLELRAS